MLWGQDPTGIPATHGSCALWIRRQESNLRGLRVNGASKIVVSGRLENRWHRNCVAVHEDQWLSVTSSYAARKPLL